MSFDELAVRENWHSRKLPGFLVDYQVKDYDNDGKLDLIVAANTKYGEGMVSSRSTIVAYQLASPEEIRKAEQERKQEQ